MKNRETTTRLVPSPLVAGVEEYNPAPLTLPIDLRLSGNEGAPPPAILLQSIADLDPTVLNKYPNPALFEEKLGAVFDLPARQVLVTAGADDALERALRAMLTAGREIVLPVPTFEMIDRYVALAGGTLKPVPWLEGALPVDGILSQVNQTTAMIMLVTPNSPTGLVAELEDIKRVAEGAPGVLLAVDLAYTEFADRDLTEDLLAMPDVIVFRTMSKAWGMAGARVGWAMGSERVISWMRSAGHPYAVSSLSLALAGARLEMERNDVSRYVERVCLERGQLTELLEDLGCRVGPSQGNFVLATMENTASATDVREGLAGLGIGVRGFAGKLYLEDKLRISLPGNEPDFKRLCDGLRSVMGPSGHGEEVDR